MFFNIKTVWAEEVIIIASEPADLSFVLIEAVFTVYLIEYKHLEVN